MIGKWDKIIDIVKSITAEINFMSMNNSSSFFDFYKKKISMQKCSTLFYYLIFSLLENIEKHLIEYRFSALNILVVG